MNTKKRPFAAFDIDGTLVRWQLYHAVTDALAKLGHLDATLYDNVRHARSQWKIRKHSEAFQAYELTMIKAFEQIIKDISVGQFESAVDNVIEEYKDQVYAYSRQLIVDLKAQNYLLFGISGSQRELVSRIASYYGFDDFVGTDYLKRKGYFTGQKKFHAHDKKQALENLIAKHNATLAGSMAIGDSSSDIPMLQIVEHPVAFNPEKKLLDMAKNSGWTIVLERKNTIYKLEPHGDTYILG